MLKDKWKTIWNKNEHEEWISIENQYFDRVKEENLNLEKELNCFQLKDLWEWSSDEFKTFLNDKYFVWKYTDSRRLATTRRCLDNISNAELLFVLKALKIIDDDLSNMKKYDKYEIKVGLQLVTMIPGLGVAGASGLLSVLFPDFFGTVDQFVVEALKDADVDTGVKNSQSLSIKDAIVLEEIMYNKADELNRKNKINYWTPRRIDKVLWTYRTEET